MAYYLRRRELKGKDVKPGTLGDWQCIHHRPHPTIKRKRIIQYKTFPTKALARAWGAEQETKYNRNPNADPTSGKASFSHLVTQWEDVLYPKLAPKSKARYEQVVRTHLLPEFGDARVNKIDRQWIRRYLARLQAETKADGTPKYAPGTVHKVLTTLSSIMSEAVEANMIVTNPCRDVRKKLLRKPEQSKFIPLSPSEVEALADAMAAKHPPFGLLTRMAAYTGLRAGELHALRKRDVNLMRGELTVARAIKAWKDGTPIIGTTKSEEQRTVVLCPELVTALAAHIPADAHLDDVVFTGMRKKGDDDPGPIHHVSFLRNHFKPARDKALPDRPNLRWHDLRHQFCSMLIKQGVNIKVIAAQAGHKSAAMTLDVYGHLMPGSDDELRSALSAAWASATEPNVVPLRNTENAA
jgi:integrase